MKITLIILGVLLLTAVFAAADPLGITVGADLAFGNVLVDNYNFAGKADPPLQVPVGMGSLKPFITYTKLLAPATLFASLSNKFGFDNPETNELELTLSGTYDLFFNNKASNLSFALDSIFGIHSLDWSTEVKDIADGLLGWTESIIPSVRYAHSFGFGSIYGKFSLPLSFSDPAYANLAADIGMINDPDIYQFIMFGIPEIGFNTNFGLGAYVSPIIQIFPDSKKTAISIPGPDGNTVLTPTAYDTYSSDIAFQQIKFGIVYMNAKFLSSVVFIFPISGNDVYADGIRDQGFTITPSAGFVLRDYLRLMVSCEFFNIGKNTGNRNNDKLSVSPLISLTFSF
jgi:hypothetical protein